MKEKELIREVKTILYMIRKYGDDNCKANLSEFDLNKNMFSKDESEDFVTQVHIGFMKGQKGIVHNLLKLEKEKKKLKLELKETRANKDKSLQEIVKKKQFINGYQMKIFRKLADSILWQLVKNDDTILKRMYCDNPPIDISNSNLNYDLEVIEEMFNSDKMCFPLLSDITSSAQIGDVVICNYREGSIGVLELKDGKVNTEIERIIEDYSESQCDHQLFLNLKEKDDNFMKQFKRFAKQKQKMIETVNTINTGKGVDNATGLDVSTPKVVIETNHFDSQISDMFDEIKHKNYSIRVINECLLVGMYSRNKIVPPFAFEAWKEGLNIKFRTVDYRESFNSPISSPIFVNCFSTEDIIKVLTGEIVIKMTFDIYKWIELFSEKDIAVRWMTEKETARLNSSMKGMSPFMFQKKAIELTEGEIKSYICEGIFSKMFYGFMCPKSAIDNLKGSLIESTKDFI